MSWNDILFSPYGRIRRRDFWIWSIVKTIAIPLLFVAVMLLTTLLHIKDKDMQGLIGIADFYLCLALFALANICLIVKRWHPYHSIYRLALDTGRVRLPRWHPGAKPIWQVAERVG
jgi:uncharacterized membrane protein YhaH (DUF805 family)